VDPERARQLRVEMVDRQLRGRGIGDERVLAAMGELPRELFVPAEVDDDAYFDGALPIASGQTISQPYIVGLMTQLLEPHPGMRVLEIGTGSGYQAAILAWIGCSVVSIERHAELAATAQARLDGLGLADRVRIEVADGSLGRSSEAPFEGILVAAAAPRIPDTLRRQLTDGGRLAIPVGPLGAQELILVTRHGEDFEERQFGGCVFVPLVGAEAYAEEAVLRSRGRWFGRFRGGRP
jgi:protein-L-isoaspartate(D-aspartate) O-methyltransferase